MKYSLPSCVGLLAAMTTIGFSNVGKSQAATVTSLFDGKTLNGWIDQENSANQFDGGDIKDVSGFAKKLIAKSDPVSACLNEKLGGTNVALQMHNGGLFDEYKDITVEVDPKDDDLITTK